MSISKSVLLPATLALCACPLAAAAQQDSDGMMTTGEVEAGIGIVTDSSFYLNEYTGITDTDPYFFGNMQFQRRSAYDGDSTGFVEFQGNDLGLPTQSIHIEAGRQGRFSVFGEYDAIPHLQFDDGQTPYTGAGSTHLFLPPGWQQGATTSQADLPGLYTGLQDLEIKTERERVGAGFSINLSRNWTFSTAFRSEEKDGLETIAGIFGTSGGNFRSAVLPRPVDFTTHDAQATFAYNSQRLQANVRYDLSLFDNNKNSLTWENAYTNFNATGDVEGQLALEPSNSAHHLSASLGYLLGQSTRLSGSLSLGRMLQDDDFLPYTINPNLLVPTALPRNSLDGEVDTVHASVGVTTRPTQSTDLKAAYTYDDRNNETPVDTYLTVPNDSADQGTTADARARRNKPYSRQSHKVELEAGYRLTADTRVSAFYNFEAINRDLQEVEDTHEHTLGAKVRSTLTETTSGYLSYDYATRRGSTYDTTVPFLVSHDPAYLATLVLPDDAYEQNPYLRKYFMSDRQSHAVRGGLNWFPSDQLTLGLNGSYTMSDYDTTIGLTGSSYLSGTFDASYTTAGNVSITGYVTAEQIMYEQTGYERGNAAILPGDILAPTLLWDEDSTEDTYTAGIEFAVPAIPNTLDIVIDGAYSNSTVKYEITADAGLGVVPLPDLTTEVYSLGVRGDYHAADGITFRLGLRYESYVVDDFALANIDEAIAPAVFALGNGEPDDNAFVAAGSVVINF